jgi:glycine dehydrogenase
MGPEGITQATRVAILNANYIATKLEGAYPILYRGENGRVAHECIIDCRGFAATSSVQVEDIAKRLADYGFHAPTMSWPVPGTLMIEPTESEDKAELDRFCEAMLCIADEIASIAAGVWPRDDNPPKNAPHTAAEVTGETWTHPYTRKQAAFALPYIAAQKYWPPTKRVDNVYGDRNLICACAQLETYQEAYQKAAE